MQQSNTNWNLYKTFSVVYETRNLHKASEILGTTRSAISQNIKELGNQLGFALFTPHSKGVEPTAEADKIYPQIKSAIDAIKNAEILASGITNSNNNLVRMGISNSSAELIIKQYLKHFYSNNPKVRLEITKFDRPGASALHQQDFIIDLEHFIDTKIYKTIPIFSITGAFIATKEFVKKNNIKSPLTKAEFFKFPIISRKEAWDDMLQQTKVEGTPPIIQSGSTDMTYSMVCDSLGIGYFCREIVDVLNNDELVFVEVPEIKYVSARFVCGYIKPLSKNARAFIDGLREFMLKSNS